VSNPLNVRRVKVQTINEKGEPVGPPSYGVMAADSNGGGYNDSFESLEELNKAIEEEGSILKIVDAHDELFPDADHDKIGTGNYYGKDWYFGADEDREQVEKSIDNLNGEVPLDGGPGFQPGDPGYPE
jgi:hypothetical protein